MSKHFDFVLEEGTSKRILFRFYPKRSSCHSFDDDPPKTWQDVYKVYYTWAILEQYRYGENDIWDTKAKFEVWDECSAIDAVEKACKVLADGKTQYAVTDPHTGRECTFQCLDNTLRAFGDGADWTISKQKKYWKKEGQKYLFVIWNRNRGYRFVLPESKMREFGEFLAGCSEYMLRHGVGI